VAWNIDEPISKIHKSEAPEAFDIAPIKREGGYVSDVKAETGYSVYGFGLVKRLEDHVRKLPVVTAWEWENQNVKCASAKEKINEHLQLMIERLETPIGEMLIVADHDGYLRALIGRTMKLACWIYCAGTMARTGSSLRPEKSNTGLPTQSSAILPENSPHSIPFP
jgi:hypothetical protein